MNDLRGSSRVLHAGLALPPYLTSNAVHIFQTSISPPTATENVSLRNDNGLAHANRKKATDGRNFLMDLYIWLNENLFNEVIILDVASIPKDYKKI